MKTVLMLVVFLNGGDPVAVPANTMKECEVASYSFNVENEREGIPVAALCSEVEIVAGESINVMEVLRNAH